MSSPASPPSPELPKPKKIERPSSGRRSIDAMAMYALGTGAASSVEDLLNQVSAVRDRKLFNALLAVLQLPHATMLCSVGDWEQKWRRRIRPGERPLVLMFPFGPVEFVFDVSQTEATEQSRPLPVADAPFAMDVVGNGREMVARLASAAEELGVRVVTARQGAPLAGEIRRVDGKGTIRFPVRGSADGWRTVPERWIVSLNQSHNATEHLATLAHELGHLFCGHVGSDQGDSWPSRDVPDRITREFEAESVARLVFRRVLPNHQLPPYLDHILAPGAPVPDQGWTYVAAAADKVIELLGGIGARPPGSLQSGLEFSIPWVHELTIRRGSSDARETVLIRATDDEQGLPERVGARWAEGAGAYDTPWVAAARSDAAFDGVLSYFEKLPGEDAAHDDFVQQLEVALPLGGTWLTIVEAGEPHQKALVQVNSDPPNRKGELVRVCVEQIRRRGIDAIEQEPDDSWMFVGVDYATGDRGFEQVLSWDDRYSKEEWAFLSDAQRLFVRIRPDAGLAEPRVVELVSAAIAEARSDLDAYYSGEYEPPAD